MTEQTTPPPGPFAGPRRWGGLLAVVWLFYLVNPLEAAWERRDSIAGWIGMVATVAFGVLYIAVFAVLRYRRPFGTPFRIPASSKIGTAALPTALALGVVVCLAVGQPGTATAVYIAVMTMLCLPAVWGWLMTGAVALGAYLATALVPHWHEDRGLLFGTLAAGLAIWGISQAVNRNVENLTIREENARLALEDQRNRFARDLHDILGHSLTVITVKAELAGRLLDSDDPGTQRRARAEVADLENLSREALTDIRRAVEGYRELSLPGEVARARSALAAAQIEARLPPSTDEVPGELRELFAWTIREGVTNVIRHSHARTCEIELSPTAVRIRDDGSGLGAAVTTGNGLRGLRERAAAAGAVLSTRQPGPGFELEVALP